MSWLLPDTLNRCNAAQYLAEGLTMISSKKLIFDGKNLKNFDSVVLALILAWKRAAAINKTQLSLQNLSPRLLSLAAAYGVDILLPS